MNKKRRIGMLSIILVPAFVLSCAGISGCGNSGSEETAENVLTTLSRDGYSLEQVVVLSRHNIRAPLSGEGSALDTITPNKWFEWSAPAVRIYANSKQRTIATA